MTQVLSSDFKILTDIFLLNGSAITNFKYLRELDRGENDVKDSQVAVRVYVADLICSRGVPCFQTLKSCFAYMINCIYGLKRLTSQ